MACPSKSTRVKYMCIIVFKKKRFVAAGGSGCPTGFQNQRPPRMRETFSSLDLESGGNGSLMPLQSGTPCLKREVSCSEVHSGVWSMAFLMFNMFSPGHKNVNNLVLLEIPDRVTVEVR